LAHKAAMITGNLFTNLLAHKVAMITGNLFTNLLAHEQINYEFGY